MKKQTSAPVFKPYVMNQMSLLPPSYEEKIPAGHLVRVVNEAIEAVDLEILLAQYEGGGTSSYHPKMLLKVLVYAYCKKIYTSRKIAEALEENIHFMWLSGEQRPDFRTLNDFRGRRMKAVIDAVFSVVVEQLVAKGYVKLENYFVDGSKIEADANKHKVVWEKKRKRYEGNVKAKIKELLEVIEAENAKEEAEYGEKDLEIKGGGGSGEETTQALKEQVKALNERLKGERSKATREAFKALEKDCLPRLEKYEAQKRVLAGRNSYSKTDPGATCMRMKEDRGAEKAWPKPAYNVQVGTEGQFVVGYSIHHHSSDPIALIPHLKKLKHPPKNVIADAAYGSEENYTYVEQHKLGNYLKYTTFYQDTHHYRNPEVIRQHQFRSDHFDYDPQTDQFICPNQQRLTYLYTRKYKTDNGYESERRYYACQNCQDCPLKSQCTKAKGNRRIQVSFKLLEHRRQARENLISETGQALRKQRSVEVETVFGDIKHNMRFRRFHLRGLAKANIEWGLICIAHNMRKLAS
jgi:transposase